MPLPSQRKRITKFRVSKEAAFKDAPEPKKVVKEEEYFNGESSHEDFVLEST